MAAEAPEWPATALRRAEGSPAVAARLDNDVRAPAPGEKAAPREQAGAPVPLPTPAEPAAPGPLPLPALMPVRPTGDPMPAGGDRMPPGTEPAREMAAAAPDGEASPPWAAPLAVAAALRPPAVMPPLATRPAATPRAAVPATPVAAAAPQRDVEIHIGRIEVVAVPPAPTPRKPVRHAVSLDDYLKRGR